MSRYVLNCRNMRSPTNFSQIFQIYQYSGYCTNPNLGQRSWLRQRIRFKESSLKKKKDLMSPVRKSHIFYLYCLLQEKMYRHNSVQKIAIWKITKNEMVENCYLQKKRETAFLKGKKKKDKKYFIIKKYSHFSWRVSITQYIRTSGFFFQVVN